ncbi:MAG TPA: aldehyde ferredoxin oxidoreductase family protein [Smithella sp.]|jgi:aldehyde:ferredoxin oxidoreductase|nr:aldehyde ferredoxin oxidoreductase family protein [Smithella sp.]HPR15383.1 aldehyde ferredoxin oxidoreductase family protein [Smithella sp.]
MANCESGYAKKLLEINLTEVKIQKAPLDESLLRNYLGGGGLAAHLFLNRFTPDSDALSADNPLIIMTGPLVGTLLPGTSRFAVCARSPQTGFWGIGTCGGTFGPELKFAGYDGIFIEGKSEKPVYLLIEDDNVEIRDAADLWGEPVYKVTDILKERHGGKRKPKVLVIGPGGENLVRFAAIANDKAHYIGRTGMGAVMGSKMLKAVVVSGTGKVLPALPEEYKALRENLLEKIKENQFGQVLRSMGTAASMDPGMMMGDVPIRNWTKGEFDGSVNIGGPTMTEKYLTKVHACYACPIACKRVVRVEGGPFQTEEGPGPEYETCCTFGSFMENDNLEGIIKANETCNQYGVDTISCGATIAFAMQCFDSGILSTEDTDGIELNWGNIESALKMVEKIARREGIGNVLAEGSAKAAQIIGKGSEQYVVAVKGLELPAHDPRGFHGMGLEYAVGYRGACHLQHMSHTIEQGMTDQADAGFKADYEGPSSDGKAEMVVLSQNIGVPPTSACLCLFVYDCIAVKDFADMIHVVTGWDYSIDDLIKTGEKIWLLMRGITNLLGSRADDDTLPPNVMKPLEEGMTAGSVPDIEKMLTEFYELRGLDASGLPRRDVLEKAGLNDLAQKLHGAA